MIILVVWVDHHITLNVPECTDEFRGYMNRDDLLHRDSMLFAGNWRPASVTRQHLLEVYARFYDQAWPLPWRSQQQ